MQSIKLGDLKIDRLAVDGEMYRLPLQASPYYQSLVEPLAQGIARYNDYTDLLDREFPESPPGMSYERFLVLREKIRDERINPAYWDPIRIVQGVVYDGQHRLAIMLELYGPELSVLVEDDVVVGFELHGSPFSIFGAEFLDISR